MKEFMKTTIKLVGKGPDCKVSMKMDIETTHLTRSEAGALKDTLQCHLHAMMLNSKVFYLYIPYKGLKIT